MAKSDTWPGGVAMETLSTMDSAGSCDSVISVNSACSEDSMEHLSAEERACLMYLEETIEALEVQEDSGLSNDEPEFSSQETRLRDHVRVEPREDQEGHPEHHGEDDASTPTLSPDLSDGNISPNPAPEAEPPAAREVGPAPRQPKMLYLSKDENGGLQIVSTGGPRGQNSEMDLSLIPPPSDFMDEPGPPDKTKEPPPPAGTSKNKPVDLELLRQRASRRETQESEKEPPEQSSGSVSTSVHPSPSPETTEPKSPPVVAPKPKKLPANIILKSHKAAPAPESLAGHSAPTSGERVSMDPQKVRMEALRKLGLLKNDEVDAGPVPSPKHSPQSRRSWAAPPSPVSPASHTPPTTPSHTHSPSPVALQSPGPVSPLVLPKPPAVRGLHIVPAPAAFRDPDGPHNKAPPAETPGDSQKLPRSQGISVMICPRSENGDERRDALKRLGLVRD